MRWSKVGCLLIAQAVAPHRRQKLNGTVTGLTHDRRVDREPGSLRLMLSLAGWFALSHQLGSRYRHGQSHVRQSSNSKSIKGKRLPNQIAELTRGGVAQLGVGDLASPRAPSLTPKQQLGAILSLLL